MAEFEPRQNRRERDDETEQKKRQSFFELLRQKLRRQSRERQPHEKRPGFFEYLRGIVTVEELPGEEATEKEPTPAAEASKQTMESKDETPEAVQPAAPRLRRIAKRIIQWSSAREPKSELADMAVSSVEPPFDTINSSEVADATVEVTAPVEQKLHDGVAAPELEDAHQYDAPDYQPNQDYAAVERRETSHYQTNREIKQEKRQSFWRGVVVGGAGVGLWQRRKRKKMERRHQAEIEQLERSQREFIQQAAQKPQTSAETSAPVDVKTDLNAARPKAEIHATADQPVENQQPARQTRLQERHQYAGYEQSPPNELKNQYERQPLVDEASPQPEALPEVDSLQERPETSKRVSRREVSTTEIQERVEESPEVRASKKEASVERLVQQSPELSAGEVKTENAAKAMSSGGSQYQPATSLPPDEHRKPPAVQMTEDSSKSSTNSVALLYAAIIIIVLLVAMVVTIV